MPKYIDRELALSHPFANGHYDHENANEDFIIGFESYKEWIEYLPTADVQKIRHGKWLHKRKYVTNANGEFKTFYFRICSECGKNPRIKRNQVVNYCPWCGAEMEDSDAEIH